MKAGEMNIKITLQRCTIAYAADGQGLETWADAMTVWAAAVTTGGREFYAAQKVNAETSALFKVRYNPTISNRMRIKWGNRIFRILPPINDVNGKHAELQLSAKEVI